jgi:hypothetical protein
MNSTTDTAMAAWATSPAKHFGRPYRELVRRRQGKPPRDREARVWLEQQPLHVIQAVERFGRSESTRQREVTHDIRTLGQKARDYHAAVNPTYLPPDPIVPVLPLLSAPRGPRRRGAGRPPHRRARRNASRDGPSDLDPPPRSPRSCGDSCERRLGRRRAAE